MSVNTRHSLVTEAVVFYYQMKHNMDYIIKLLYHSCHSEVCLTAHQALYILMVIPYVSITVITELLINNIIIKYIKFNIAADPTLIVHMPLQHVKPTYHPWKPKVTLLCNITGCLGLLTMAVSGV